jgi:hypothetical protein
MDAMGRWWLAVSNGSTITNQMWGTWDSTVNWVNVQTGDFNGDGLTDIVGRNPKTGDWNVALSTGSSFTSSVWGNWSTAVNWVDVHAADFTGDGKADLTGRVLPTGRWWVETSLGTAFSNGVWDTWPTAVTWVDVKVGDFNGDGKADLTGRVLQTGWWWTDISMGSSFTSSRWVQWDTSATWVDVQVGDFNGAVNLLTGDKIDDITGRRMQDGSWFTSLSNGTSFQTPTIWSQWPTTVTWVDVKIGDFNGDGKADITGRVLQTGRWWVAQSNGSSAFTFSPWGSWSTAVTWVDVNVGDFNGDGQPDLVGRDPQTGIWWASLSTSTSFMTPQLWTMWAV